jgi:putative two-component system response regulator
MESHVEHTPIIMVVDDTQENLVLLSRILQPEEYRVMTLSRGDLALQAIRRKKPDLILLDVMMPGMSGFDVCEALMADPETASIPVLFLSALSDPADKVKAFALGAVDYITKPFDLREIRARVGVHLELLKLRRELEEYATSLEKKVEAQVRQISEGQLAVITAMTKLTMVRHDETGRHIERTQALSRLLAKKLATVPLFSGLIDAEFIENIFNASPLHDIGKIAIRDEILLKPGKLHSDEYEEMKSHAMIGSDYLSEAVLKSPANKYLRMGVEIAANHHEWWDGTGYPAGLAGRDIPLSARIISLVDVYDALRSKRVYKEAYPHERSVGMILEGKGSHFDPDIVEAFLEIEQDFRQVYDSLQ